MKNIQRNRASEERRWQRIYKKGAESATMFKIASEEDIYRILHEV